MARLILRNRRVFGLGFAIVTVFCIGPAVFGIAIIGVNGMACRATGGAIVARLFIGSQEPEVRIVQARLGQINQRYGNSTAGAGSAIGLFDIGTTRLVELLQLPGAIGQTDIRKL